MVVYLFYLLLTYLTTSAARLVFSVLSDLPSEPIVDRRPTVVPKDNGVFLDTVRALLGGCIPNLKKTKTVGYSYTKGKSGEIKAN